MVQFLLTGHDAFSRDSTRLEQVYELVTFFPLGGCAIAGADFSIGRNRAPELLGFDRSVENRIDAAGGNVDTLPRTRVAVAIAPSNLGRMPESICLWNTARFAMDELADESCFVGSSMPKKKNPADKEGVEAREGKLAQAASAPNRRIQEILNN